MKHNAKRYAKKSICRRQDDDGEYMNSVKLFKKELVKNVNELWAILDDETVSHWDAYKKADVIAGWLTFLKEDISDYDGYEC